MVDLSKMSTKEVVNIAVEIMVSKIGISEIEALHKILVLGVNKGINARKSAEIIIKRKNFKEQLA